MKIKNIWKRNNMFISFSKSSRNSRTYLLFKKIFELGNYFLNIRFRKLLLKFLTFNIVFER